MTFTNPRTRNTTPTPHRAYQLVCEGACNPTIASVDEAVSAWRRYTGHFSEEGRRFARVPPIEAPLVARLRQLTHTAHVGADRDHAICTICGTERRYGRE